SRRADHQQHLSLAGTDEDLVAGYRWRGPVAVSAGIQIGSRESRLGSASGLVEGIEATVVAIDVDHASRHGGGSIVGGVAAVGLRPGQGAVARVVRVEDVGLVEDSAVHGREAGLATGGYDRKAAPDDLGASRFVEFVNPAELIVRVQVRAEDRRLYVASA